MSIAVNDLAGAYRKLLASMSVTPQSDDLLIQSVDGIDKQVLVEGKPLALPTTDIVNNYSDSIVVFHPLCENLLLGESPVLQEFRALIMDFLNDLVLKTVESVLSIAIDDELMTELSPTQVDFMRSTAGADINTLKNWRGIMRRAEPRGSCRVVTVFLKRGSELNGEMQKRVGIVNFNIYHELTDGKLNIFGAKIRKADAKVYIKILETIFEDIFTIDAYSAGSNALTAPYFDALVNSYHNVIKAINSVTWNLRKPIKQSTGLELHVKDEFMDLFKDLMKYRDVLPTLPLNDGDRQARRKEDEERAHTSEPIPANELPGVSSLTRQSTPYYEPAKPVTTIEPEQPVNVPTYSQAPAYAPQQPPAQMHMHQPQQQQVNTFPTLEEQLSGVPMGGYPQNPGYNMGNPYGGFVPQNPYMNNPVPPQPQQQPYGFWGNQQQQQPQQPNWSYTQPNWGNQNGWGR